MRSTIHFMMGGYNNESEYGNLSGSHRRLKKTHTRNVRYWVGFVFGERCTRSLGIQQVYYILHEWRSRLANRVSTFYPYCVWLKLSCWSIQRKMASPFPQFWGTGVLDMTMFLSTIPTDSELHLLTIGNAHIWHKHLNLAFRLRVQLSGRALA